MSTDDIRNLIKAKRIASFDYGFRRVGWAVCDEMHISTTPKGIFSPQDANFWSQVCTSLARERIGVCLVGIPYRLDSQQTKVIVKIREFIHELQMRTGLVVLEVDESFTSKRAVETMIQIGVPKLQRRSKERTDEIAAAIMLRDFLLEHE